MGWSRLSSWTLRRRVLALFATAGVLMAGIGALAVLTAADNNEHLDVILEQTGPMRVAGQELYSAYLDQETGVRGFALSRSATNLAPYERGREAEQQLLARIAQLNGEDGRSVIVADLQQVRVRAQQWRTDIAEPVIAAGSTADPAQAQRLDEAANTARFDQLRAAVDQLQAHILDLRNDAATAARRTGSIMLGLELATTIVVLAVGALMLALLDSLVNRPITALAAQVRAVAAGDYEREIVSAGSPELRALSTDVDGMRRRIATDLAEVRQARAELEQATALLETKADELTRSNRDLEQFAYVASHDLQEPLRKVASFCQLLQRRYAGQLDARADQYIAFATDGAQRMQRLINDLLAFSRIGRMTSGFTLVDLGQLMTQVVSQLDQRIDDETRIEWGQLPTVQGEEPLLTTLFVNLVGNSLKFHRPDVPPAVTITVERDDQEWRINVRDNGIGIEREFADKVFVIFQRLHSRDSYEGTGIGLAIVKKIVEYHGGRIWLDLEAEQGTSVWFTLPAFADTETEDVREAPLVQVPAPIDSAAAVHTSART